MTENQRLEKVALHLIAVSNNQIILEPFFFFFFLKDSAVKIMTKTKFITDSTRFFLQKNPLQVEAVFIIIKQINQ